MLGMILKIGSAKESGMRFVLISMAWLGLSCNAMAADDIMANYYGNTVIGKSALGESHTHYKADHTFTADLSSDQGSMQTQGTWAMNDKGEICRTYSIPIPGFPSVICNPWSAHKIGDQWQTTFNGRTSEVSLVAGIQ
jgi:hypothetical protein